MKTWFVKCVPRLSKGIWCNQMIQLVACRGKFLLREVFVNKGFCLWSRATEEFHNYESSALYSAAVAALRDVHNAPIFKTFLSNKEKDIKMSRGVLEKFFHAVQFIGQ